MAGTKVWHPVGVCKRIPSAVQRGTLADAFSRAADFSGVSASAGGRLEISAVIHKAFVEVNEEGMEAAEATGVINRGSRGRPSKPIEFRADHPFLFLIRHEPTASILFMGHFVSPK